MVMTKALGLEDTEDIYKLSKVIDSKSIKATDISPMEAQDFHASKLLKKK
jgi:hypothetical protein